MHEIIDLRSDTVTLPTPEMREAMKNAQVGDDGWGEDPTLLKLEDLAAKKFKKEAALFVVSGTMGNQVSIMTHTHRGDEIIVEEESHIFNNEMGVASFFSGVQTHTLKGKMGFLDPDCVKRAIRPGTGNYAKTALICLENTHNRAGGTVCIPEDISSIALVAKEFSIPVHLDGARIFNAAIALKREVHEFTKDVDSVMFCLSKGLSAPVGSMVVGNKSFIEKARKTRRMFGGGIRQGGILAAAGIVALEKMVDRLAEDHENAKILALGIHELPGITLDLYTVQSNIIIFKFNHSSLSIHDFIKLLAQKRVRVYNITPGSIRLVVHKDIDRENILKTIKIFEEILKP